MSVFEHYSAPKESVAHVRVIVEKARFARLDILKHFIRGQAQAMGTDFETIDHMLALAPELTAGQTAKGKELNLEEKLNYHMLSMGCSAVFAFQLIGLQKEDLSRKMSEIEDARKAGLTADIIRQGTPAMTAQYPHLAHVLENIVEYVTALK